MWSLSVVSLVVLFSRPQLLHSKFIIPLTSIKYHGFQVFVLRPVSYSANHFNDHCYNGDEFRYLFVNCSGFFMSFVSLSCLEQARKRRSEKSCIWGDKVQAIRGHTVMLIKWYLKMIKATTIVVPFWECILIIFRYFKSNQFCCCCQTFSETVLLLR